MNPTITLNRNALAVLLERLSPLETKVLLVLLSRASPESGRLRTSVGSFASAASLPESLVRCALPRLADAGLVQASPSAGGAVCFDISGLLAGQGPAPENLPVQ